MMERIIKFRPAFDRRNSDPKKNYGIHGVELAFYLKGEEGVIQFLLYTNWQLPHVQQEFDSKTCDDPRFTHLHCRPMPVDIGYHSPKPMYDGQESLTDKCELLDGKPCYYDGSALGAERYFNILVAEGEEALWKAMEECYHDRFKND